MPFEIITTKSGVRSVRSLETGEVFHPVTGPMAEATVLHADQQRLGERAPATPGTFVVWDVGLGAAANAIAVLNAMISVRAQFELHSFDVTASALEFALRHQDELGYVAAWEDVIARLIGSGSVDIPQRSGGTVRWKFHGGDFRDAIARGDLPAPSSILYDPYSPARNREMWTLEHLTNLRAKLADEIPCLLTNYTRSTKVRVTLLFAGFFVGRGRGVGEKEETTVATNDFRLIERPLEPAWLDRVAASTDSAPLRAGDGAVAPIKADDFARLRVHPQFR